jgi:hypothetical protein
VLKVPKEVRQEVLKVHKDQEVLKDFKEDQEVEVLKELKDR